jgi:hypothetical protein
MRVHFWLAMAVVMSASGCTFGHQVLPDGFDLMAKGGYCYSPLPYAEGGLYYDFIGLGWLVHKDSDDDWHLSHDGKEIGVWAGWKKECKLSPGGERRIGPRGWSLSEGRYRSRFLVGWTSRQDLTGAPEPHSPPKRLILPGMEHLNGDDEMVEFHQWTVNQEPLRAMDPSWNMVVFLLDVRERIYRRIAGFSASHYELIGITTYPAEDYGNDGYVVEFVLRDIASGKLTQGTYTTGSGSRPESFRLSAAEPAAADK